MSDTFSNARAYFDPTFPSSGDGFDISKFRNAFAALAFMDALPLQPRAHNPANRSIMIRGRDSSNFFNPVYAGDSNARVPFISGDTANFATPASNPRIDIVYMTPSGDYKVAQGGEAASPTLPTLAPSGDSRFPICAVFNRPGQAAIWNFEDKGSHTGDGYIYQDLRPWMRGPGAGSATVGNTNPVAPTGDAQVTAGSLTTAARSDHVHGGVHGFRMVSQPLIQGDVEIAGAGGVLSQSGNRISIAGGHVQTQSFETGTYATAATTIPHDNTIPQISEGTEYMTVNITPKNAANKLKITVNFFGDISTTDNIVVALFQDAIANALAVGSVYQLGVAGFQITFTHLMFAGTTSQITFRVRAGTGVGQTMYFNGYNGGQLYGGQFASSIVVDEIAV